MMPRGSSLPVPGWGCPGGGAAEIATQGRECRVSEEVLDFALKGKWGEKLDSQTGISACVLLVTVKGV